MVTYLLTDVEGSKHDGLNPFEQKGLRPSLPAKHHPTVDQRADFSGRSSHGSGGSHIAAVPPMSARHELPLSLYRVVAIVAAALMVAVAFQRRVDR